MELPKGLTVAIVGKVVGEIGMSVMIETPNGRQHLALRSDVRRVRQPRAIQHRWRKIGEGLHECRVCEAEAAGYDPRDTVPGPCPGKETNP